MKKALTLSLAISMLLVSALAVIPANAGIGTRDYRVFYVNESVVGNRNGDADSTDDIIVLYEEDNGHFTYIGEGYEPEISGSYVMWHSREANPKLYIYKIGVSSPFIPFYYRTYGYHHELHGSGIAYNTHEGYISQDVNGDNDMNDKVVAYIDLSNFPMSYPTTYKTGEKTQRGGFDGDTLAYVKYEAQEGQYGTDLNGDQNPNDSVIYYMRVLSSYTETPAARKSGCIGTANQGTYPRVGGGDMIVWTTDESKDECNWGGGVGTSDWIVAGYDIIMDSTHTVDLTESAYEGHHYAGDDGFVYETEAYAGDDLSQSIYTENFGQDKLFVFVGEPIRVVGSTIQGYAKEGDLDMDLNNDGDKNDEAMWIFDESTGQTEILLGGDDYWK